MSYLTRSEARDRLLAGVQRVAEVVSPTLGPKGHFVVLGGEKPIVTNDGATIAQHLKIEDPYERIGAEIVKQVALNVAKTVGDGTTTATILTSEILQRGLESEEHSGDVTKDVALATVVAIDAIKKEARPATKQELIEIGQRACKNKVLGEKIASLIYSIGADSHVFIKEGLKTDVEVVQGSVFQVRPLINTADVPIPTEASRLKILCLDYLFTDITRIIPVIEQLIETGVRELVVVCEGIDGEALRTTLANHSRNSFSLYAIKAEDIKGISTVAGARLIQVSDSGNPSQEDLGEATVIFSQDRIALVNPKGDISRAISLIENSELDQENKNRQIAQISGHVGFLTIEAIGETDLQDKKIRSDDGIRACQATLRGGVVDGGGMAYERASKIVESKIMSDSLLSIKKTIDENAGYEVPTDGVVDPTLVLTTALMHATTAACQLINSEAVLL